MDRYWNQSKGKCGLQMALDEVRWVGNRVREEGRLFRVGKEGWEEEGRGGVVSSPCPHKYHLQREERALCGLI